MQQYSREFLKADINHRRLRLKHHYDLVLLELEAMERSIAESKPATEAAEHMVYAQHATVCKDHLAESTADFESLADLCNSLKRCDC